LETKGLTAPGINTTAAYKRTGLTCFPVHKEDVSDSIGLAGKSGLDFTPDIIHHGGATKVWYSVAPQDNERFERVLKGKLIR
jgi:hypothetical protein